MKTDLLAAQPCAGSGSLPFAQLQVVLVTLPYRNCCAMYCMLSVPCEQKGTVYAEDAGEAEQLVELQPGGAVMSL